MILDGWGKTKNPKTSAIDNANTSISLTLYMINIQMLIFKTDGLEVGLPMRDKWEIAR